MKFSIQIPLACLLVCGIYSCGDSGVDAKEMTGKMSEAASNLTPDALKEMAPKLLEQVTTKLGEIKDKASATKVTEMVEPMLDKLKTAKTALGEKMPDMGSLSKVVEDLKTKFSGDAGIMEVIQPIIDKVKGLMG